MDYFREDHVAEPEKKYKLAPSFKTGAQKTVTKKVNHVLFQRRSRGRARKKVQTVPFFSDWAPNEVA